MLELTTFAGRVSTQCDRRFAAPLVPAQTLRVVAVLAACCVGLPAARAGGVVSIPDPSLSFLDLTTVSQATSLSTVFAIVLLQQLGFPVPAFTALLIAGSLAVSHAQLAWLIAAATVASLCADIAWYAAGRAFGYRILSILCKLSLKPGSCVSAAEDLFTKWGLYSLVIAKFVPGFSTVGPPIAGALKLSVSGFLVASSVGAGLWAGAGIVGGWVGRAEVRRVVEILMRQGSVAVVMLSIAVLGWLGWLTWRKRRFDQSNVALQITASELCRAMNSDAAPLLLDLRKPAVIASGAVSGAVHAELNDLWRALGGCKPGSPIVTLCGCPADAAAVKAAHRLAGMGYTHVRVLRGGYESWKRHVLRNSTSLATP